MRTPLTLSVDCGGGGIKASVLDKRGTMVAPSLRVPTPYPLPPEKLIEIVEDFRTEFKPETDRITVGMPGMIRHGVVISTPIMCAGLGRVPGYYPKWYRLGKTLTWQVR